MKELKGPQKLQVYKKNQTSTKMFEAASSLSKAMAGPSPSQDQAWHRHKILTQLEVTGYMWLIPVSYDTGMIGQENKQAIEVMHQ